MIKITHLFYRVLILTLLFACLPLQANSLRIFNLSADNWARPRTGDVLPQMESLRLAVSYWDSLDDAGIMLSYPGEDSGELWAAELKDWLISLGIPSDYIYLSPGLQTSGEIRILVGHRQELEI
jgi:hypothetical protein